LGSRVDEETNRIRLRVKGKWPILHSRDVEIESSTVYIFIKFMFSKRNNNNNNNFSNNEIRGKGLLFLYHSCCSLRCSCCSFGHICCSFTIVPLFAVVVPFLYSLLFPFITVVVPSLLFPYSQ